MNFRDHDYMSHTNSHPIGAHTTGGGSGWGAVIVLLFLFAIFGLAIVFGSEGEQSGAGNEAPALEQTAPATDPATSGEVAPPPVQPIE